MSQVASKNLYELLGNDHDEDSDKEPEPPTRAIDKALPRTSKRNAPDVAPSAGRGDGGDRGRGGRRGGFTGSEEGPSLHSRYCLTLFEIVPRDLQATVAALPTRETAIPTAPVAEEIAEVVLEVVEGHEGDVMTVTVDFRRWGANKGDAEWDDEQAGEAIAKAEEKADGVTAAASPAVDADGNPVPDKNEAAAAEPEPEPEDLTKSYAEYLAEQAQRKLDLGVLEVRKPNENAKQDKKWAQAKELKKVEDEDAYIAGAAQKARRERQRKEKTVLDIDQRFVEPSRGGHEGGRGGRGGSGRGRGEGRGDFRGGERGGRGGRGRGEFRGGRGGGGYGGRGGSGASVNVSDTNAFPSLGGKA
ncbi:MAG: hypothetical protein M1838_000909 [Thelocarpon superellum]|nr:MAG: hypothetical protein M1838_000909 [Thelocarpon superellum]